MHLLRSKPSSLADLGSRPACDGQLGGQLGRRFVHLRFVAVLLFLGTNAAAIITAHHSNRCSFRGVVAIMLMVLLRMCCG